jgi:hypothetical protein
MKQFSAGEAKCRIVLGTIALRGRSTAPGKSCSTEVPAGPLGRKCLSGPGQPEREDENKLTHHNYTQTGRGLLKINRESSLMNKRHFSNDKEV